MPKIAKKTLERSHYKIRLTPKTPKNPHIKQNNPHSSSIITWTITSRSRIKTSPKYSKFDIKIQSPERTYIIIIISTIKYTVRKISNFEENLLMLNY